MVERIRIGYANCYLLSGDRGSVLIDTCNYKDGPKILKRIKDRNVKLILLTHGHFDHVSSAKYLSERLNVPIAINEKDVHIIGNGEKSVLHGTTLLGRFFSACSMPVLKRSTYSFFEPDILLEDGQDLSQYGVKARVIALPGHTKGSVGVLTDDGEIIVGDAMFNIFRPTVARIFEEEKPMLKSVETIRSSGAKIIYVGHGRPIKNI